MKHTEGFLKLVDDARSRVREVNVEQTLERVRRGARLVDVREDNEWQRGHAAGAEHMGRGIIERDIETAVPDHNAKRAAPRDARAALRMSSTAVDRGAAPSTGIEAKRWKQDAR